ncbi:hypothetical protein PINS_up017188 [Pythium insidiosum]|nr:hypothetical protein PINS_up017188 [Pythium insidiosum]
MLARASTRPLCTNEDKNLDDKQLSFESDVDDQDERACDSGYDVESRGESFLGSDRSMVSDKGGSTNRSGKKKAAVTATQEKKVASQTVTLHKETGGNKRKAGMMEI